MAIRKCQFESAILILAAGCARSEHQRPLPGSTELEAVGGASSVVRGGASQGAAQNATQGTVIIPGTGGVTVPSGGASGSSIPRLTCLELGTGAPLPQVDANVDVGAVDARSTKPGVDAGANVNLESASLPSLPEGRHVTMRIAPLAKKSPAVAASGSVLGMAFQDGNRLRFGVNADPTHDTAAWSFVDVAEFAAEHPEDYSISSTIVSDNDGFDVVWTGADYLATSSQLWRAKFNRAGKVVDGPYLESTGGFTYCSLAKHQGTLAIACAQAPSRYDEEQDVSVWVELCDEGTPCRRCALEVAKEASRPAIAWDGNAFDIVFSAQGSSNSHELRLVRIGAHAEYIQTPRVLDSAPAEKALLPGLVWDGEHLVVAHGDTPTISVYDLEGKRVRDPVVLVDVAPFWTIPMGYQVLATPTDYAVVAIGSGGDGAPSDFAGVRLMSVARAVPDQVSTVLYHPHDASPEGPAASATVIDGEVVAVKAPYSSNLQLGRFNPSTLEAKAELRFVFEPPGPLSPVGVQCDAATCYVLAHESDPSMESSGARTGVWQVERATGRVIAPDRAGTAIGMPRAIPRMRAGQFVAALGSSELIDSNWADAPRLTLWRNASEWSSYPWPGDSPYEEPQLFFEGDALRLFYKDKSIGGLAQGFHRVFADAQYGAPTPISVVRTVQQCGNAYIRQDISTGASTTQIMRWRPGVDADFAPFFEVPFEQLWGMCCSNAVILAAGRLGAGIQPTTRVYSINGTLLNEYEGGVQQCASRNDALLVLPDAERDLKGYRVYPDGTLKAFELGVPNGLLPTRSDFAFGSGPWNFELGEDALTLAWNDLGRVGTYFSLWRIPE